MNGFFITGTDTEVGKTLVTAAIILLLQTKGFKVCGYKPVVAGMTIANDQPFNEDLATLVKVSNQQKKAADFLSYADICPYQLPDPIAPHINAQNLGIKLDLEVMVNGFTTLKEQHDYVIVEGAGGFLVPISETRTLADFATRVALPVILVIDIKLGCINHALLTVQAILHNHLKVAGWVANSTKVGDNNSEKIIATLKNMLNQQYSVPLLGNVPFENNAITPYADDLIQKVSTIINQEMMT